MTQTTPPQRGSPTPPAPKHGWTRPALSGSANSADDGADPDALPHGTQIADGLGAPQHSILLISDRIGEGGRLLLYDSGRNRFYIKPSLRGWLHLLWFEASLVLGVLVILAAHGPREVSAATIYAASVSAMFGTSALYHLGNWQSRASAVLQRADHLMIFLLIAGTVTPAFLLAAQGTYGIVCLAGLWLAAAAATCVHLARMTAPELLVGATFVGLGSAGAFALPPIWLHNGVTPALLMLAGGGFYVIGAIAYHRRSPDPAPAVFGYHEVFHACVCAAAACQYIAITLFIL